MDYFSPFHVLDPEDTSPGAIKAARKRWMAEFELADTSTITIAHREFDREGLEHFFRKFKDPGALGYHRIIYDDPPLLRFLEQGRLPTPDTSAWGKYEANTGFLDFVAPWFATRMDELLLEMLIENRHPEFLRLLAGPLLTPPELRSECYTQTGEHLQRKLLALRAVPRWFGSGLTPKSQLVEPFYEPTWMEFVNQLPPELGDYRNAYTQTLWDQMLDLYYSPFQREDSFQVLMQVAQMNADEEITRPMRAKVDEIRMERAQFMMADFRKQRRTNRWVGLWSVLVIGVIIGAAWYLDDDSRPEGWGQDNSRWNLTPPPPPPIDFIQDPIVVPEFDIQTDSFRRDLQRIQYKVDSLKRARGN